MTYQDFQRDETLPPDPLSVDIIPEDLSGAPIPVGKPTTRGGWLSGPQGLLIGLGLGLALAFGATKIATSRTSEPVASSEPAQVAATSVTIAEAETAPVQQTIQTSGTVQASDLLSVSPRASGLQILSVLVQEGDRVAAGQTLAVLDDSVLSAQIDQAQAEVSAAQAQVTQAEAQVAQNRASLSEAQESLGRYESLFAKGAISQEELTSRRTTVATETQTVGSAIAAVDSAEANVRSQQAEVDRLKTQLNQTQVLAPASGVIATKTASVGDTATAGTPLFEIISGDQLELAVKIPSKQLAQVNVGTTAQITFGSDENLQLQGTVRSIDPTVDPQTRQATVKIGLPGSDRLKPGMFLKVAIVTGSRQGVVVPADAVLPQSDDGFIVYTVNADSSVKAQPVDVGTRIPAQNGEPAKIEIQNGLQANTPVVVEGAGYLQDGEVVDVIQQSSAESSSFAEPDSTEANDSGANSSL